MLDMNHPNFLAGYFFNPLIICARTSTQTSIITLTLPSTHWNRIFTLNSYHSPSSFLGTVESIRSLPLRDLKMASDESYKDLETPANCYADFCLIPVGTGNASVAEEVAAVKKLIEASGLAHTLHSAGTTVEGSWDEVMKVIGQAHSLVHKRDVVRVQSSMRVGTRTDKKQTAAEKVKRVEDILKKETSK
ncbi:YkoF-like protein [Naviculisporaceae sp. PSN 640]